MKGTTKIQLDVYEKVEYIETKYSVENLKYMDIFLCSYIRPVLFGMNELQDSNNCRYAEKLKHTL